MARPQISPKLREAVLSRDQFTCQMCGARPNAKRLRVVLFDPSDDLHHENLRTVCQVCASGLSNIVLPPRPTAIALLTQIRRARLSDQRKVVAIIADKLARFERIGASSTCNEGLQNAASIKPDRLQLLAQTRRTTIDDQQALLEWLLQKFKLKAVPKE